MKESMLDWLTAHGIRIALVLVFAVGVSWAGRGAVRKMRRRLEGEASVTQALNLQRATTLTSILSNGVRVVVWAAATLMILGELGLDLAPLLAGAGIAGIAIGFGAQSLVKDFLSGFFLILEDQLAVGDMVQLNAVGGTVEGRVEGLTLRATSIRAADGTLSIVPNGNLQLVANRSRGHGRVAVEIRVPDDHEVEGVTRLLNDFVREAGEAPEVARAVTPGSPRVEVDDLVPEATIVRVVAETRPYRREQVEESLRRRIGAKLAGSPLQARLGGEDGER
jgi:moderate conductance mechanosensitive channel